MKNYFIALLLLLVTTTAFAQDRASHHSPKTTSKILLEQVLTENERKNNLVRIETVVFPPSYGSPSHTHPCPLFVYVLEGELTSEFEAVKKVYKAGDTFYERPNGIHSVTTNNSSTLPAKILVIYLMKPDTETFLPIEH